MVFLPPADAEIEAEFTSGLARDGQGRPGNRGFHAVPPVLLHDRHLHSGGAPVLLCRGAALNRQDELEIVRPVATLPLGAGVQINLDLVSFSRRRIALFAISYLYHQIEIRYVPKRAKARAEIYAALQLLLNPLVNAAAPHRVRQSVNLGRDCHLSGLRRAAQRGFGSRGAVAPLEPVQKRPDEGRSDCDESRHDCGRPPANDYVSPKIFVSRRSTVIQIAGRQTRVLKFDNLSSHVSPRALSG